MSIAVAVRTKDWLIGVYGLHLSPEEQAELDGFLTEGELSAADVMPIKWKGGREGFRDDACEGDSVIRIWRENEDAKEPTKVYRHAKILLKREARDVLGSWWSPARSLRTPR